MKFYKDLFFEDGKPVPVAFVKDPNEDYAASNLRRMRDNGALRTMKYTQDQIEGRTMLQNFAKQRALPQVTYGQTGLSKHADRIALLSDYQAFINNFSAKFGKSLVMDEQDELDSMIRKMKHR